MIWTKPFSVGKGFSKIFDNILRTKIVMVFFSLSLLKVLAFQLVQQVFCHILSMWYPVSIYPVSIWYPVSMWDPVSMWYPVTVWYPRFDFFKFLFQRYINYIVYNILSIPDNDNEPLKDAHPPFFYEYNYCSKYVISRMSLIMI